MIKRSPAALLLGAIALSQGCSDETKFQTDQKPSADVLVSKPIEWLWNCQDSEQKKSGQVDPSVLTLLGPGPHQLTYDQVNRAPIALKANVCGGELREQLVTFVVDVSGSMHDPSKGNDPPRNGSCQRMKGIDKMIDKLQAANKNTRFSLVAFTDRVIGAHLVSLTTKKIFILTWLTIQAESVRLKSSSALLT